MFDKWTELKNCGVPADSPKRKHIQNKIETLTKEIAIYFVKEAKHQKAKYYILEDTDLESEDLGNSVANTKCNNLWHRNTFVETRQKQCAKAGIRLIMVKPDYSSFEGNLIFRKFKAEPDMNLAALELGRRGFELISQRIEHTRPEKKNIIFPEVCLFKESFDESMEEFGLKDYEFKNWKSLYVKITKSGTMYRRKLEDCQSSRMTRFYSKGTEVMHRPLVYKRNMPVYKDEHRNKCS